MATGIGCTMGVAAPRSGCNGVPAYDRSAGTVCTTGENGGGSVATRTTGCGVIGGIAVKFSADGFGESLGGDGLRDSGFGDETTKAWATGGTGGGLGTEVTGATPRSVAMTTGGDVIGPVCVIAI